MNTNELRAKLYAFAVSVHFGVLGVGQEIVTALVRGI